MPEPKPQTPNLKPTSGTIYIGGDHAGYQLKEALQSYLTDLGYRVIDKGPFEYDESDDYPDFVVRVARAVADDPEHSRGVVIGGSGQGEAMAANRISGVRAAVFYGPAKENGADIIALSREHNDANVLSLGARFIDEQTAKEAVKQWLETEFPGEERHMRRIKKIDGASF